MSVSLLKEYGECIPVLISHGELVCLSQEIFEHKEWFSKDGASVCYIFHVFGFSVGL